MAIPYGFEKMADGNVRMVASEIVVVQRIYQCYVDGTSLGGITTELEAGHVIAPSGNVKWSPTVADVAIKELICKELGLAKFDEQATQGNISQVLIATDSMIDIVCKCEMILQL